MCIVLKNDKDMGLEASSEHVNMTPLPLMLLYAPMSRELDQPVCMTLSQIVQV